MSTLFYLTVLFAAKVLDNALGTTKTIFIQRSRWLLAGVAVVISDFIYFWITKRVVSADSSAAMIVVAVAGGVGCSLACLLSDLCECHHVGQPRSHERPQRFSGVASHHQCRGRQLHA